MTVLVLLKEIYFKTKLIKKKILPNINIILKNFYIKSTYLFYFLKLHKLSSLLKSYSFQKILEKEEDDASRFAKDYLYLKK
jgi:hypothetical protein